MTNPYLVGNFAPVHDEIDAEDLPVVGQVPFELDGVYLRIGPNPRTVENGGNHHWFVGDGMLHGVGLQDGRARWYRNRWVRAAEVEGPASPLNEGSNTAVAFLGGRLYSLTETCMPVEITRELDTVRRHDFGGPLPFGFSAHPQRHPRTGEVHAAAYWIEPPYVYHHVELIR